MNTATRNKDEIVSDGWMEYDSRLIYILSRIGKTFVQFPGV